MKITDLGNLWGDFFQIALGGVDVPFVVYDWLTMINFNMPHILQALNKNTPYPIHLLSGIKTQCPLVIFIFCILVIQYNLSCMLNIIIIYCSAEYTVSKMGNKRSVTMDQLVQRVH